jgi:hypothetical protein
MPIMLASSALSANRPKAPDYALRIVASTPALAIAQWN